ncbi:probable U3 snoRNP component Imp4p [Chondrus crispus]|uniref:Probable U3 snoRNP component Imp4p n=1 Tax=Chondrus crispus TaxID=2769 RepID=R7QAA5_CHOCR|nr:probable U3 snoRNP component Imp4p [Chondrus crispus]CDF34351.1 probable U3 snoRNP component Imp4p [Chondrus crispus]|eukprot:XP_005714170.1 probable U3 snoRNP component Imp4p [Chondrus crispus]
MLRREARQRREYLYRKSLEGKRAADYAKRLAIRTALAEGRPIPTELKRAQPRLSAADAYADALHDAPTSHVDDEYATAARAPPRVVVTTSRAPSARLSQFAKEIRLVFPDAQRLNRGSLVITELVAAARANGMTDVVVLHENRGQPDGLIVSHLPYGPTAYFSLRNVVMRHDIEPEHLSTMSEAAPHLIFHGFDSRLGARVADVLKYLFPVPKPDSKRIMSFCNFQDEISFRHHTYMREGHQKEQIDLKEVGPRFEMQLYQLRLGTLDQDQADDEWVLRPHMNTAKRRKALG